MREKREEKKARLCVLNDSPHEKGLVDRFRLSPRVSSVPFFSTQTSVALEVYIPSFPVPHKQSLILVFRVG